MGIISGLITVFVLLMALSVLVIVHELGHYLAAKYFGVKVIEFGLGYPPKAKRLFEKWGTVFSLNWLPFGGFVRLHGEERKEVSKVPHFSEASRGRLKVQEVLGDRGLFYKKRKWQRIVIVLSGIAANFVLGVVAFSIVFSFLGIPEPVALERGVLVGGVSENSPALEAGVMPGDVIVGIGVGGEIKEVVGSDEFIEVLAEGAGQEVDLRIEREGERVELVSYARRDDEVPEGDGALGVGISDERIEFVKYSAWQMPLRGAYTGLLASLGFGYEIVRALGGMVADLVSRGVVPEDVAGPVGIFYTAHRENILGEGILGILNFMGILSVNLAIVNLLPIPALDGGRAVFIILEKVLGKWFKPEYERYANLAGMVLLLALIGLVSIRDLGNVIGDLR